MTVAVDTPNVRPRGHGLGARLVFWMVVASSLLSVLASAIQLYFSYQRDLSNTREALDLFERSFRSSLSSALWEFNFNQIDVILDSLAADKDVARIDLTATTGQRVERGSHQGGLIYKSIALDRIDEAGITTQLGDLRIGITLANVNARLWSQFWTLLTTNMAKTTAASCVMLLLFHWLVAKHLRTIAIHVRGVDLDAVQPVLGLARRPPMMQDDLDAVVAAINAAQSRIRLSYETIDRLNRQLESTNQELSRSNEELQRFAFIAAHDLQEPLRKISAFGDLLVEEYSHRLEDEGREYVGFMVDAAARQQALVKDLLAYSLLDAQDQGFESLDLTEVVQASLQDLAALVTETGGHVDFAALPTIMGGRSQMQQVFTNLIGNALKYRSPDRAPKVTLRAEEVTGNRGSNRRAKDWRIIIKDNGIGFPEDKSEEIFQLFRRLHPRVPYGGTGIGLAIVRKIVLHHSGTIVARSKLGSGSVFTMTLPASVPSERSCS